jgi:hypothetical protein
VSGDESFARFRNQRVQLLNVALCAVHAAIEIRNLDRELVCVPIRLPSFLAGLRCSTLVSLRIAGTSCAEGRHG